MALKKINPTTTRVWKKLSDHFIDIQGSHLKDLFKENPTRASDFSINFQDITLDYSKNNIHQKTMDLLIELVNEIDLKDAIQKYFSGNTINETEKRAVLHTALRADTSKEFMVDGINISTEIQATLNQIENLTNAVVAGKWKGYSGKKITDIVNIGIGGSDLGPQMVVNALQFYKNHLKTHFVSNVDGDHVSEILKNLHPETTLFVIVSKTFTTQETLSNAQTIKEWFLKSANQNDINKHFVAVSTNIDAAVEFGIEQNNIFPMWNWVGGRFSLWSSVGLSISLAIGYNHFIALLKGASEIDTHFKEANFNENIPVILALIGVWYTNFFNCQTEAILPYSEYLNKFVPYL